MSNTRKDTIWQIFGLEAYTTGAKRSCVDLVARKARAFVSVWMASGEFAKRHERPTHRQQTTGNVPTLNCSVRTLVLVTVRSVNTEMNVKKPFGRGS